MVLNVMAEACNISRLACVAAGASPCLCAICSASGYLGLLPCSVIMAECIGVTVNIAVATCCTCVSGVALCSTGRCSYNCLVIMAEACNFPSLSRIATSTSSSLLTLFGAGGSFSLLPCTIIVAKCVGVSVDVAIATGCAGVSGVTLFRACGLGDNCVVVVAGCGYLFVSRVITAIASVICCPAVFCASGCLAIVVHDVVAESRYLLITRVVAARTGIICIPAYLGASCCFCLVIDAFVTEGIGIIVDIAAPAHRAGVGGVTLDRAGRCKHLCYVFVSGGCCLLVGRVIATGAGVIFLPALFGAGLSLAFVMHKVMTQCVGVVILVAVAALCAGVGRIAFFGAGRCGHGLGIVMYMGLFVLIMDRCRLQALVCFAFDRYVFPLLLRAGVIHIGERGHIPKRCVLDGCNAYGNNDAHNVVVASECMILDGHDPVRNNILLSGSSGRIV